MDKTTDTVENENLENADNAENIETVEEIEAIEPVENIENTEIVESVEKAGEPVKSGRNLRKERIGMVVSNKMQKTAVVEITERVTHSKYSKIMKRSTRYKVHDENNDCDIGDKVLIMETRPLSKDKHFRLVKILEKVK